MNALSLISSDWSPAWKSARRRTALNLWNAFIRGLVVGDAGLRMSLSLYAGFIFPAANKANIDICSKLLGSKLARSKNSTYAMKTSAGR
ncbi:hypothetical protein D3C71_1237690 [compost metagenome]